MAELISPRRGEQFVDSTGTPLARPMRWIEETSRLLNSNVTNIDNSISTIEGNITNINNSISTIEGNIGKLAGINYQDGTSYTLQASDIGKVVEMDNASANTVTIPPDVFASLDRLDIQQVGDGLTTIVLGSGVTSPNVDLTSRGKGHGFSVYARLTANSFGVIGGTSA